jgi:hypothetical protein
VSGGGGGGGGLRKIMEEDVTLQIFAIGIDGRIMIYSCFYTTSSWRQERGT